MKICKDCRYYVPNATATTRGKRDCIHPKNIRVAATRSAVTGMAIPAKHRESAITHRSAGMILARLAGLCGKEGRWFRKNSI